MTLEQELAKHKMIVDADDMACSCGEKFVADWYKSLDPEDQGRYANEQYHAHYARVMNTWLADNHYGDPLWVLNPGTTCQLCGCVVGLVSKHREWCA